jgi:hypothetical protein
VLAAPGCVVQVYEPLSGLHRPTVIDARQPNFTDTRLMVHCLHGGLLSDAEAGSLCDKVRTLFVNQGAEVRTFVGAGDAEGEGSPPPDAPEAATEADPRLELTLDLRARKTDQSNHPLSWAIFIASFTVLPAVQEWSFAQEVVIRDETGFLLTSDTLEGRWVWRYGFGAWLGNALLDLSRKKVDRLGSDAAAHELSDDLYNQLTQDVFDAKMHASVLRQSNPVGPAK